MVAEIRPRFFHLFAVTDVLDSEINLFLKTSMQWQNQTTPSKEAVENSK
ncbi:hypothetical protein [Nostoc sp. PA-18-2419]|nr:hypothetical protein [Nostoc sp. PA-18-2419]